LRQALQAPTQRGRMRLQQLQQRLQQQKPQLAKSKMQNVGKADALKMGMAQSLSKHRLKLKHLSEQLELLNPQRTLERGYVILSQTDGNLIRSGNELHADQHLLIRTAVDVNEVQLKQVGKPQNL
jgi:exodeoxyribonuclease VII large subunit